MPCIRQTPGQQLQERETVKPSFGGGVSEGG